IGAVEYLRSKLLAVPTLPSSPIAVQLSRIVLDVGSATARSVTGSGASVSGTAMARQAFRRPPLTVFPARPGTGSEDFRRMVFIWATVSPEDFARMRAQAPDTCGAAIEV